MDCAGAEQSASDPYFAMPVSPSVLPRRCLSHFASALFPASPVLFLLRLRLSLPLYAGAICHAAPALFFVHSRRHPWHCANESVAVTRRGALIKHGGERRSSARLSAGEGRGIAPALCGKESRLMYRQCSRENCSTPHSEKFEYQHSNNTRCCRFNTSRIKCNIFRCHCNT